MDSYEDAKYFYKEHFAREQQKVINDLKNLRDEIQEEERAQKEKAVGHAGFGIVGGTLVLGGYIIMAPVVSFAVTTCGAVIGVSSVVARYLYNDRAQTLIKKKLEYAEESLKRYDRFCLEMNEYLLPLKRDIKSLQEKIELISNDKTVDLEELLKAVRVLDISMAIKRLKALNIDALISKSDLLIKLIKTGKLDTLASIAKEVAKVPLKVSGTATAILIILDMRTITFNEEYLKDFASGRLCVEAQKLDHVITDIELEAIRLRRYFD